MVEKRTLVLLLFIQWYASGKKVEDRNVEGKAIARITKGVRVSASDYPHVVAFFNDDVMCGGSIITSRAVLTAGHCLDLSRDPQYMAITYGANGLKLKTPGQKTAPISDFKLHSSYTIGEVHNDVALLFMNSPLHFGKFIKRAFLVDTDEFKNTVEAKYAVTGWGITSYPNGKTSRNGLQMIYMRLVEKLQCQNMCSMKFPPEIFCLYGGDGKDTCDGDSGSGVIWSGMLTGITSYGFGCGKEPSLFTSIYDYIEWIEQSITEHNRELCHKKYGR